MGSTSNTNRWQISSSKVVVLSYRLCMNGNKMEIQIDRKNASRIYTLTDKDYNRHLLVRLEVLEGRKSLGVYIAVDGNKRAQEAYLTEMAKKYAEQI